VANADVVIGGFDQELPRVTAVHQCSRAAVPYVGGASEVISTCLIRIALACVARSRIERSSPRTRHMGRHGAPGEPVTSSFHPLSTCPTVHIACYQPRKWAAPTVSSTVSLRP
jgi:hypothetical protein